MSRRSFILVALIASAATLPVCASAQAAPDTTVILKSEGSSLEFLPDRISLKAGTRVRVRYTNNGSLPHNLVFAKSEDDLDALTAAAYQAGATHFVPMGMKDKMIAWTELLSAGKTAEVVFVVPPPGDYPFICLFPGHAAMMIGTLRSLR